LYAAGSPVSVGLAKAFASCGEGGAERLMFFGGMGDWNHFW
jgi:hypothetical protein